MAARLEAWRGSLRLASGLTLLTFLTTHFLNHALGLVSLEAMEAGRHAFLALWRNPVGGVALYGAVAVHVLLALWSVYRRRTLRLPAWQWTQLLLGLLVPPLVVAHVLGTRGAALYGQDDPYQRVLLVLWQLNPVAGARQAALVGLAWLHGSIGVHYWLRVRPWYAGAAPWLLAGAVLLPALALLGFVTGGREVARRALEPGWIERTAAEARAIGPEARAALGQAETWLLRSYLVGLALAFGGRGIRQLYLRRVRGVRVRYAGGREVSVPPGTTVLEASRRAGIPHASVCGGRGRCSTCRVRVTDGLDTVPPAGPDERRVLARIGAAPNVRLACQLRPTRDLAVTPLLPPTAQASEGAARPPHAAGAEREVTVLFADLRGFTTLAEHKLPYDVVFFLNRYFEAVGSAIERSGGVVNQFTGDGVMALFGVEGDAGVGARAALRAAGEITRALGALSRTLGDELAAPLRMGIGIHVGPAVVGRMGYKETVYLTAVGDTVHVASRFQELTKQYDGPLVISEAVARRAGLDPSGWPRHELTVRNRHAPLVIHVVADLDALAAALAGPGPPGAFRGDGGQASSRVPA